MTLSSCSLCALPLKIAFQEEMKSYLGANQQQQGQQAMLVAGSAVQLSGLLSLGRCSPGCVNNVAIFGSKALTMGLAPCAKARGRSAVYDFIFYTVQSCEDGTDVTGVDGTG